MSAADTSAARAADGHRYLAAEDAFLGVPAQDPLTARAVVLPFGLEASVSYGGGTAAGPAAMIAASHEVELFDELWWREPVRDWGVATRAPVSIPERIEDALDLLAEQVEGVLAADRFPIVFGGEHSVTPGAIRPAVARWPDLVLLHFDAHADLRDGYDGEPFSHAAAIRRCLDHPGVSTVSVGIRNISAEEVPFLEANRHRARIWWSRDRRRWDLDELIAPLAGRDVWITFDVDGLDATLMPATGTPEPGGLSWDEAMDVLAAAARVCRVVGADVNELAPLVGFHAPDFTAARLAYRILSFALSGPPVR